MWDFTSNIALFLDDLKLHREVNEGVAAFEICLTSKISLEHNSESFIPPTQNSRKLKLNATFFDDNTHTIGSQNPLKLIEKKEESKKRKRNN